MAAPRRILWVSQRVGWLLLAALGVAGSAAVAHLRQPAATLATPANFPALVYEVTKNHPNEATFELGRQLFYDPRLSSDGTVSCGSCHQQSRAFTDGQALALGVGGRRSARNTPALQNLGWHRSFMADGGVRGYLRLDREKWDKLDRINKGQRPHIPQVIGKGLLAMLLQPNDPDQSPWQSLVPIEGATLADCAQTWFTQSEQIPTRVRLAVGEISEPGGTKRWRAGGAPNRCAFPARFDWRRS